VLGRGGPWDLYATWFGNNSAGGFGTSFLLRTPKNTATDRDREEGVGKRDANINNIKRRCHQTQMQPKQHFFMILLYSLSCLFYAPPF
jgi:hypothetical protein